MVKSHAARDSLSRTTFANVIELDHDSLLLESSRVYEVGDSLTISLAFPGIARGSKPVVSFACVVHEVRDSSNLHYDVRIQEMSEPARRQLAQFLEKPGRGAGG
jgi:hypothetical protein